MLCLARGLGLAVFKKKSASGATYNADDMWLYHIGSNVAVALENITECQIDLGDVGFEPCDIR